MGGGRPASFPHPAGCIFFYAIIVAHNLLVVNGIFLFKLNNEKREAFRMRCHYRKALFYLYQSFLVQLEHRVSAAAPFGGVRGNAPEQVGGFLLCFGDDSLRD